MAFERTISGKGFKNPIIIVKTQSWPYTIEEVTQLTPAELRTADPKGLKILKEEWHSTDSTYPYLHQIIGVNRVDTFGNDDPIIVHAIHIIISNHDNTVDKILMSFEMITRADDDAVVLAEYSRFIVNAQIEQ